LDNQPITGIHPVPFAQLKISGLKMRCPNFKRGCKTEMLAGKEFQTVLKHHEVCAFASLLLNSLPIANFFLAVVCSGMSV
jgi:hypothetical protein